MGRPELARALRSLDAQTYRPIETVIVDAKARGLGRTQAANAGMEAANGEWLIFLDEDDELEPSHIADLLSAARSAGTRVAYSQTRLLDHAGRSERVFGGPFNLEALRRSNYLAIHAVLFSRAFVTAGCRFDESLLLLEDWDFWLQLARHDAFAFTGKPTAIYHGSAGQSGAGAGQNLDREMLLAQRARLMQKWGLA